MLLEAVEVDEFYCGSRFGRASTKLSPLDKHSRIDPLVFIENPHGCILGGFSGRIARRANSLPLASSTNSITAALTGFIPLYTRKLFPVLLALLLYPWYSIHAQTKPTASPLAYDKLERGTTTNDGRRVGKWNFYNSQQELELAFDYDSSRISFVKTDTTRYWLRVDDQWQLKRPNRAPHALGSMEKRMLDLARTLRYPTSALVRQL